jgi:hypothetical protein
MDVEQLWKLLDSVQGHIRAFDTKAQVALGLDSLLAGLIGAEIAKGVELSSWNFDGSTMWLGIFTAFSIMSLLGSVLFAIRTALPRLHLKQPTSHFFFCHLVELYGRRYGQAAKCLVALSEDQIVQELAMQVQVNAVICDAKSRRCVAALRLMMLSLVFYLISFLPFGALAHRQLSKAAVVPITVSRMPPSERTATVNEGK